MAPTSARLASGSRRCGLEVDSTKPAMPHITVYARLAAALLYARFSAPIGGERLLAPADNQPRAECRTGHPRLRGEIEVQIGGPMGQREQKTTPAAGTDHRALDQREPCDRPIAGDAAEQHLRVGFEFADPPAHR